nr:PAK-box P21-Rho-binding domain containing protein [Haemonchus contortus]
MANDDDVPRPPPRKSKLSRIDKKPPISAPFNFRHVCHVGSDFRSEDVKRAISSKSLLEEIDNLPEAPPPPSHSDGYEKVTPRHSQWPTELDRTDSTSSSTALYENVRELKKRTLTKPDDGNGKAPERSSQPNTDSKRTLATPDDGNDKAPERSSQPKAESKRTLAKPDDGSSKAPERSSKPEADPKCTLATPNDDNSKAQERSSQPEAKSVSQQPQQSLRAKSLNLDDAMPKVDVSWYQHVDSAKGTSETPTESCESIEWKDTSEMNVRISKKTKPAPSPPTSDSPKNSEANDVSNNEGNVMWRATIPENPSKPPASIHLIKTPEKIQKPSISSSMVLERPDDLGNMSSRLEDTIPVPSSVSSQASPAVITPPDRSETRSTRHWISELPPEEQKRISGMWQEATGETEIPDDSIAVRKAIAMFEARLHKRAPPPRPPPPRRRAPPSPIKVKPDQDQRGTSSTDATTKNSADTASQNSSTMPDSKNTEVVLGQDAGSHSAASPCEKVHDRLPTPLPTSSQQFPIPKPRLKLLGKLEEDPEIPATDASHTSNIVLPEYFVEECLLSLSLKSPKGVEQASCEELRRVATIEKAEATYVSRQTTKITIENVRLETSKASNETSQAEKKANDTEENVVITRF